MDEDTLMHGPKTGAGARFWKIRRKKDGLFSTGGYSPRWKKTGKTWSKIGFVKAHLAQLIGSRNAGDVSDWEVVEYVTTETGTMPARRLYEDAKETRAKREAKYRQQSAEWERKRKLAQLEQLKKELDLD